MRSAGSVKNQIITIEWFQRILLPMQLLKLKVPSKKNKWADFISMLIIE